LRRDGGPRFPGNPEFARREVETFHTQKTPPPLCSGPRPNAPVVGAGQRRGLPPPPPRRSRSHGPTPTPSALLAKVNSSRSRAQENSQLFARQAVTGKDDRSNGRRSPGAAAGPAAIQSAPHSAVAATNTATVTSCATPPPVSISLCRRRRRRWSDSLPHAGCGGGVDTHGSKKGVNTGTHGASPSEGNLQKAGRTAQNCARELGESSADADDPGREFSPGSSSTLRSEVEDSREVRFFNNGRKVSLAAVERHLRLASVFPANTRAASIPRGPRGSTCTSITNAALRQSLGRQPVNSKTKRLLGVFSAERVARHSPGKRLQVNLRGSEEFDVHRLNPEFSELKAGSTHANSASKNKKYL
jgi:hypothetical protein